MSPNVHVLSHGSRLILPAMQAGDGIAILVGGGRCASLRIEGPVASVWLPLRGRLQLCIGDGESAHYRGILRAICADVGVQATGRGHALWLALIGAPGIWHGLLATEPVRDAGLLPATYEVDRALLRRVFSLMRAARSGDATAALEGMIDEIAALQERFNEVIVRCPGRSWASRRQAFLRLQRVREHLVSNCHLDLDNDALARIASYSPWHFVRAFQAAYRETPHAFLVRQRLQRAQRMLRSSPLAIGEIALACGFENRSSFSRLFHERFGVTANSTRAQALHARSADSAI